MNMTPRQISAYLQFGEKLNRIDRQAELMITAIGSQGDKKAIEKLAKELGR